MAWSFWLAQHMEQSWLSHLQLSCLVRLPRWLLLLPFFYYCMICLSTFFFFLSFLHDRLPFFIQTENAWLNVALIIMKFFYDNNECWYLAKRPNVYISFSTYIYIYKEWKSSMNGACSIEVANWNRKSTCSLYDTESNRVKALVNLTNMHGHLWYKK